MDNDVYTAINIPVYSYSFKITYCEFELNSTGKRWGNYNYMYGSIPSDNL